MAQPIIPYVNADNVGSAASLLQVLNRELKKSSANIGDGLTLLVINNGEISTSNLNLGSATKFVFLQNGRLQISSSSVGSDTKIIKIANGEFQESAGNAGSDIKFVYLQNGTITPTNRSLGSNSKHIFMSNGALTASNANIGGMEESYIVTSDSTPVEGKQYYKKDSGADTYTEITSELTADTDLSMLGYNVYERPVAECHIICMKNGETVVPDKASIGNEACFLYLENGALKATKINAGQSAKLIEFVNGKLKESSASVGGEGKLLELKDGQLVESDSLDIGGEDKLLYVQGGRIVSSNVNIGSDTRTLKVVNGQLVEGSVELAPAGSIGEGGGTGGGVIDGVLCKDADDNDVVTKVSATEWASSIKNDKCTYEYEVKNDCLLNIQFNADVTSSSPEGVRVYIGDVRFRTCVDTEDSFTEAINVPVKKGTIVKLVSDLTPVLNIDDVNASRSEEDYAILFQEFRLNSLSVAVGLPNYDKGEDITSEVTRTSISESRGFKAPSNGYVLFQANTLSQQCVLHGYVADVLVYISGFRQAESDFYNNNGIVPVRKGDVVDFSITNSGSLVSMTGTNAPKVFFFPIQGSSESSTGPIEIPLAECEFTAEVGNNPFITNGPIVSPSRLHISASDIKDMTGRDVNLAEATVSVKVDLFYPKYVAGTTVPAQDEDGFAIKDTTKPMFRDELMHWSGAFTLEQAYTIGNVSSNAVDIHLQAPQASRFIYLPSTCKISGNSGGIPTVDDLLALSTFVNTYAYSTTTLIPNAESLGLSKYYIRLTAVIDPNRKNIIESKSGMFVTGDIAKDENGNVCKTLVPYTEWAAKQDSDGKYVYEYTVKTDCWLHADYLVHAHSTASDEVVVTINGEVLGAHSENGAGITTLSMYSNTISMPVKRGTKIGFHSVAQPDHDWGSNVGSAASEILKAPYAIKILEFKMGTELNPAQFPSLAVRVCDVDCHDESTNASVLPDGGTCEYFTWTESQMRQVFGSAFDFDHARFDVSAVFYVGNSTSDYDTADNKLQDDGILISPTGQGQQVRPSVTIDTVNGERIAKLALPGIDYFCSTVKSDVTSGFKLVTRTDGIHLSIGSSGNNLVSDFNTDYSKKVRMRLLLHVSDRRSEASHMYTSTPDWDESKIEVLFDRRASNLAGSKTIQRDGWLLVNHGGGSIWYVEINGISVVANHNTSSTNATDVTYTIPVSAGDVVSWPAVTSYDDAGDRIRFVPPKYTQLEVPDLNIPANVPKGISSDSKMVRQADMVMIAAASGPSYSNEITITESGVCVLIGNIDSDDAITATDTVETVGIQALIGGEWRTLATQLVVTQSDGCGNQNFSFNVEAGLKLRVMCNFGITEGEDSVAYTSSVVPELNTHKRVVSWVIC